MSYYTLKIHKTLRKNKFTYIDIHGKQKDCIMKVQQ